MNYVLTPHEKEELTSILQSVMESMVALTGFVKRHAPEEIGFIMEMSTKSLIESIVSFAKDHLE